MAKGKYKEWLEKDNLIRIKSWARDGLSDKEIAGNIGISVSTFYEWCKNFSEFSEAIKKGREPVPIKVEDTFFEKKLQGYKVIETTKEITVAPDGSKTQHFKEVERYIPPDTAAMIFYLKNRMPDKYRDKPQEDKGAVFDSEVEDELSKSLRELGEGLKSDE